MSKNILIISAALSTLFHACIFIVPGYVLDLFTFLPEQKREVEIRLVNTDFAFRKNTPVRIKKNNPKPMITQKHGNAKSSMYEKDTDERQKTQAQYQEVIKSILFKEKRYPLWARKQKIEGESKIYFKILSSGDIENARIITSSGIGILDKETLATLKRVSPLPAFPEELVLDSLEMQVSFKYTLSGGVR
ncbi:energy transducer TonB [Spirochaetota bacterium]